MDDRDPLDAMLEGTEATSAPQTEATPAATPEAPAEQPRDETGRFAPKAEPQPAAAPAVAAPETIAPVQPAAQAKPLIDPEQFKGYLEEREKRQAIQAERDRLAAELKAVRDQQQAPSPNFADDPQGYIEHQRKLFAQAQFNAHFTTCQRFATKEFGADTVKAALDWGQAKVEDTRQGTAFAQIYASQEDPVEWIVKQYKRDQLLSQIGDKDPVEWAKELLAAQSAHPNPQASPASPQSSAPPSATPLPSPSLVSARSAGGLQTGPIGPGVAFDALFPK